MTSVRAPGSVGRCRRVRLRRHRAFHGRIRLLQHPGRSGTPDFGDVARRRPADMPRFPMRTAASGAAHHATLCKTYHQRRAELIGLHSSRRAINQDVGTETQRVQGSAHRGFQPPKARRVDERHAIQEFRHRRANVRGVVARRQNHVNPAAGRIADECRKILWTAVRPTAPSSTSLAMIAPAACTISRQLQKLGHGLTPQPRRIERRNLQRRCKAAVTPDPMRTRRRNLSIGLGVRPLRR